MLTATITNKTKGETMNTTVVKELAHRIIARANCVKAGNDEWFEKHTQVIRALQDELPSGSGFDSGTKVDLDRSSADKLVLTTAFHHMNENGMYDGWTEHDVIVTPSLAFGFDLRITGRDRNDIKECMHEMFQAALSAEIDNAKVVESVA